MSHFCECMIYIYILVYMLLCHVTFWWHAPSHLLVRVDLSIFLCFIFNSLIHMQVLRSSWNLGSVEIYSRPIVIKYFWIFMDGLINVFSMLDIVDCRLSTTVSCKLERWSNATHIHLKSRFPATVLVLPDWGLPTPGTSQALKTHEEALKRAESERIRLWTVDSEMVGRNCKVQCYL